MVRVLLALAGLLLLLPGPVRAETSLPGPGGTVDVEAATVTYDVARERFLLEGGVRMRRGEVLLRARTASYDPATGTVDATGDVLLTAPGRVIGADGVHAVLDGAWEAREVRAFYKEQPLDLSRAATVGEAAGEGRNRLTLSAGRASGEVPTGGAVPRFAVEDVRLTLCDCCGGAPSWELRASRAEIVPGEVATLSWPVLWITPRFLFIEEPIPVLPLPWLQVPLSGRQTGLLVPQVTVGSRTGWWLAQPFFLTLGPSWDTTVAAGYAFGPSGSTIDSRIAQGQNPGVRGAGGSLELRWAPSPEVKGEARLLLQHDTLPYAWKPASGWRTGLVLRNEAHPTAESFVNAEGFLAGDAVWTQDFVGDVLQRDAPYLRSALAAGFAFPHLLVEADLAWHEQIGTLGQASPPGQPAVPLVPFGVFGASVPSFHRLPAVSATLLPIEVAGPLSVSAQAGVARFAPISGITDQSVNGLGPGERGWLGPAPPPGDTWVPGQRLAATRAWARAEVRAPLALGGLLLLEPWAAGNGAGYVFGDGAQPALASGWVSGGATLSTTISRTFGSGADALRHVIEPRVEWRLSSGIGGTPLPAYAYDERDAAPVLPGAPCITPPPGVPGACLPLRALSSTIPGGFDQMRIGLRNRLVGSAKGSPSQTRLELDLAQDLDLASGRLGESLVRAGAAWGPVEGQLVARFLAFGSTPSAGAWGSLDPGFLDAFTELRLDLAASDARGDRLTIGFLGQNASGSPALRAGLDPLFDPRAVPFQTFGQGTAGVKVHVAGGLDVQWDTLFSVRTVYATPCGGGALAPVGPSMQQNTFTASWSSPCKCWSGLVKVQVSQCGYYGVSAGLDLGALTGIQLLP
ncbi:MAG TPA: LPS-assembly protein LptD [Anaeromyxobacteraceae bacterium]|nr:LPS-assembly protein LptD [Anaeromyxobacteraceae bacterium]